MTAGRAGQQRSGRPRGCRIVTRFTGTGRPSGS